MVMRILFILIVAGMVVIGIVGCSSAPHPGAHAPTGTPALRSSLTPALPRAPRVGDIAPNFALDTLDGTSIVHLSDYSGQPILLNFWAITCPPCVKEQSVIQKFYEQQQAAGKRLIVLGVDIDQVDNFVNVATLQHSLGLTYPILVDDHFQARTSYQITDVPQAYFLDRQHVIRSVVPGSLDETVLHNDASNVEG